MYCTSPPNRTEPTWQPLFFSILKLWKVTYIDQITTRRHDLSPLFIVAKHTVQPTNTTYNRLSSSSHTYIHTYIHICCAPQNKKKGKEMANPFVLGIRSLAYPPSMHLCLYSTYTLLHSHSHSHDRHWIENFTIRCNTSISNILICGRLLCPWWSTIWPYAPITASRVVAPLPLMMKHPIITQVYF